MGVLSISQQLTFLSLFVSLSHHLSHTRDANKLKVKGIMINSLSNLLSSVCIK